MGKKKKEIKDKKLQRIRNSKIKVSLKYDDKKEEYYLYISISDVLEPATRPRTTSRFSGMYDPLSGYKKFIKNIINNYIYSLKNSEIQFPYDGPVRSIMYIYKKPNKTESLKDKFIKILYKLPVLSKPDIDNVEKTIWDICNGLVYQDDNQIYSTKTIKKYSDCNKTIIKLYFEELYKSVPEEVINMSRLSKEENEYIKSLYDKENED